MTINESPRNPDVQPAELERLERSAQALWSVEPDCSLDDRFDLMTRLSTVSAALDRMRVRGEIEREVLEDCGREVDTLAFEWALPWAMRYRDVA